MEVNSSQNKSNQMNKSKFSLFSETGWVEKHMILDDFNFMYEPLQVFLEAIVSVESGLDSKSVGEAYGFIDRSQVLFL